MASLVAFPVFVRLAGLRPGTVRAVVERGELVPIRIGGSRYLDRRDAELWFKAHGLPVPKFPPADTRRPSRHPDQSPPLAA